MTKSVAEKLRAVSHPNDVAQLVMMRIDHVNSKKDELTIAVKSLADTAKQLVSSMPSNKLRLHPDIYGLDGNTRMRHAENGCGLLHLLERMAA